VIHVPEASFLQPLLSTRVKGEELLPLFLSVPSNEFGTFVLSN